MSFALASPIPRSATAETTENRVHSWTQAKKHHHTPTPCCASPVLGWAVPIGLSEGCQPAAAAPVAAVCCCCECDISTLDRWTDRQTERTYEQKIEWLITHCSACTS